jgi:hypothetical protein
MIGACRYYFSTSEKGDDMCRESAWVGSGGDEIRRNLEYVLHISDVNFPHFCLLSNAFALESCFGKTNLTFVFFRKYLKKI